MPHAAPPPPPLTIDALLARQASLMPGAAALCSPGRPSISYATLSHCVTAAASALRASGIDRSARVAIVTPNGPLAAMAFLAVAACAAAAPLNPDYREFEFDFYLSDLDVRALLVPVGMDSPARAAARARGIPVLELCPTADGLFALQPSVAAVALSALAPAQPGDVALVLHTSGTTARPKQVPLTHENLCRSARNIGRTLALSPADRCLNAMPLFHIHGLVGALLSSLAAGASVFCAPGFYAPQLLGWLPESRASWYTAVPSMHQALLTHAWRASSSPLITTLRFIRSSSAPLPPSVLADLQLAFGVPVIEAYGMTEAAHQIASNPLPPGLRKPGSVGLPAGPAIAVLGADGGLLPAAARGEIAIRGASVMRGYAANPAANAAAFANGWFRTGDEGYLDADGYLFITGRLKELINRGGEKIAPREIDEALLAHPAVAQAVAFALPDVRLGETVAAAVVLRPGASADERELRSFVAHRLADFKVPVRIVMLAELPKGPTGKPQRIGLAAKLRLSDCPLPPPLAGGASGAPATETERVLAGIWSEVLALAPIGRLDNFLELGGDSVLAALIISRVRRAFDVDLPLYTIFAEASTIAGMSAQVENLRAAPVTLASPIQPQPEAGPATRPVPPT